MIDSVLKGTGNSRFLKSAVPAGTSWAEALAMLQAGTFPVDFNGINTEGFQQVGTPLNKANLLKDATSTKIGLPTSTTPDGMFQALGNTGELHVWRKTVVTTQEIPAGYKLETVSNLVIATRGTSYAYGRIDLSYSTAISVDDNGGVSLTNSSSVSNIDIKKTSSATTLNNNCRGKFCLFTSNKTYPVDTIADGVYYIPSTATFTVGTSGSNNIVTVDTAQKVVSWPLTPAGTTTTYPVSTNPNAYQEGDDAKAAGYVVGEVKTGQFLISDKNNVSTPVAWEFSDNVTVADDGSISLKDPSEDALDVSNYESSRYDNKFKGKFVSVTKNSVGTCSFDNGTVYFISSDATISKIKLSSVTYGKSAVVIDRYQPVAGYAAIPAGTTIEYMGKLGNKAMVQVMSYVGTGTCGESNPNSLTFDFVPKMVIVAKNDTTDVRPSDNGWQNMLLWVTGIKGTISYGVYVLFSQNGKTLSWYSFGNSVDAQCNYTGVKYTAIAIS